jgi:predicted branched-subunit amino acid permease
VRDPGDAAGPLLLVLFFGDAWLLRAYLPSCLLLLVLSAGGVAWIAHRLGHGAAALAGALALALTLVSTRQSLFGPHLGPLYVQKLYDQANDLDHRHVDDELYALLLAERKDGERVAVYADKACIYKLLDRGIVAREDYLEEGPVESWPAWIVGAANVFERSRFFEAQGGPYVLRAKDRVGRHALYQRVTR